MPILQEKFHSYILCIPTLKCSCMVTAASQQSHVYQMSPTRHLGSSGIVKSRGSDSLLMHAPFPFWEEAAEVVTEASFVSERVGGWSSQLCE